MGRSVWLHTLESRCNLSPNRTGATVADLFAIEFQHRCDAARGSRDPDLVGLAQTRFADHISMAGDPAPAATTGKVQDLRPEARALKECVADLTLENRLLKKSMIADGGDDE